MFPLRAFSLESLPPAALPLRQSAQSSVLFFKSWCSHFIIFLILSSLFNSYSITIVPIPPPFALFHAPSPQSIPTLLSVGQSHRTPSSSRLKHSPVKPVLRRQQAQPFLPGHGVSFSDFPSLCLCAGRTRLLYRTQGGLLRASDGPAAGSSSAHRAGHRAPCTGSGQVPSPPPLLLASWSPNCCSLLSRTSFRILRDTAVLGTLCIFGAC